MRKICYDRQSHLEKLTGWLQVLGHAVAVAYTTANAAVAPWLPAPDARVYRAIAAAGSRKRLGRPRWRPAG